MEKTKISKTQILMFSALIVVFISLFPFPMSRSRQELYVITETYYDEVPTVVNKTVSIPYQVVAHMQWQVNWSTLTPSRQWGASVGTQTFSPTFRLNWGYGAVYGGYTAGIGFVAEARFYQEIYDLYKFTLGSDDGSRLYLDGRLLLDLWSDHAYTESSVQLIIESGWHTLALWYYNWVSPASVYFNVDKGDLFRWEETQYLTTVIPQIQVQLVAKQRLSVANRTITETVYASMLEYLMEGGRA